MKIINSQKNDSDEDILSTWRNVYDMLLGRKNLDRKLSIILASIVGL